MPVGITGSSLIYGRGGVGRTPDGTVAGANGGSNTGNGGGGGSLVSTPPSGLPASAGGSGVVIIAYPDTYAVPTSITGTYNEPTRSGYRVYRFTGSGSITF